MRKVKLNVMYFMNYEILKIFMLSSHDFNHMLRNNKFVVKKYVSPQFYFILPTYICPSSPSTQEIFYPPYKKRGGHTM